LNPRGSIYSALVTVLEGIQKSAQFLGNKGIDTPRLQAELLLAHVLRLPRMQLYLNFERTLTPAETETYRECVLRRSRREPLQHITGATSFCGFEIVVNRHVLVPRPETELLAEAGWRFLQAPAPAAAPGRNALDFGTGSGCIAIALAAKCPGVQVVAIDVSADAIQVARQNAAANKVEDRIQFVQADRLSGLAEPMRFDLIVSNPPYIPTEEIESLEPEVRDHEPRGALDGGSDGLEFYRQLAEQAGAWLKPHGKLMAEFGDGQEQAIVALFEKQNWIVDALRPDYTQRPRILEVRIKK
jgi:release factor glutamine methyltransferase